MSRERRRLTAHVLAGLLGDWRDGPGALHGKLSRRLGQLLADGRVASDVRLPAERPLASALGVSRTTIIRAYETLHSQGLIESHRGVGRVSRPNPASARRFVAWSGSTRLDSPSLRVIDFAKAVPGADARIVAAVRDAAGRAEELLGHDGYSALGFAPLRAAVAARYERRGLPTAPEQIMITAGAQQALDLLVRMLVKGREAVVVESPTYPGALDSLRLAGARLVGLDVSKEPWALDAFETLVTETGARLAYLVPDFQNPTGRVMPDADRERLAHICHRYGLALIVDETLTDVVIDGDIRPPVAAHDPASLVISIGSLSKVAWGGLRVGWIRATPQLLATLAPMRAAADLGGAIFEQLAAVPIVTDLDVLVAARRPQLARQRDALIESLATRLGWKIEAPAGGLSAWVELPSGSSSHLADVAYRRGLLIIPGPRFSPDGVLDRCLRLPYSLPPPTIVAAVRRLCESWEEAQRIDPDEPRLLRVV